MKVGGNVGIGDGRRSGQHQLRFALSSSNPRPLPPAPSFYMSLVDSSPPLLFRWQLVGVTCMFTAAKESGNSCRLLSLIS